MKTIRTIIISSALLISAAHANLIDLTLGGFNIDQGLPPSFHRLQTQIFFDEAAHGVFGPPPTYYNGWVSQYGALNGGTYFFTNLFTLGDTPSASFGGTSMVHRTATGEARLTYLDGEQMAH